MGYRPVAAVNPGLPEAALTEGGPPPMVHPLDLYPHRRRIMRGLGTAALAAMMLAAAPAMADNNLDLSKVTCKDFLAAGKDNISIILTWLDAYYLSKDAPPVIDFDRMAKSGAALGKYCGENSDATLSKAADQVMSK
jgi:acid stress chaperone HdeB